MKKGLRILPLLIFILAAACIPVAVHAVDITTSELPAGIEMVPYSATLEAINGVDFVWHIESQVVAWGANWDDRATVPVGLSDVIAIAGGLYHSLAQKSDGTVVAWGANWSGQATVPEGLSDVIAIAGGGVHSLALTSDGTVVAWGDNGDARTTVPTGLSEVIAIAGGGDHSLAQKSDGTVVAWGANWSGQTTVPTGLSEVIAIAGGGAHSLALKSDGTVVAWGSNGAGQTTVPTGLSEVIAIAGGGAHSLALKSDGTVVAWGSNGDGQATVPTGLSDVISIAGGASHSLALKSNGTVVAWGDNWYDQTTVPAGFSDIIAIASGGDHNLMLRSASTQLPLGLTLSSQGTISGTPTLAGTYTPTFSVQNSSGSSASKELEIVIEPNPNTRPVMNSTTPPEGMVTMAENSSQAFSVTAHDPEGEPLTYAWTLNGESVGDDSNSFNYFAPWGAVGRHQLRCYVSDDLWQNEVFAVWQVNVQAIPIEITTMELPQGMEMVPYSATMEAINGVDFAWSIQPQVVAWGLNESGQTTVPAGLNELIAIAGGLYHSLALKSDGTVAAWGNNEAGQATVPTGLSDVIAIAGGLFHSLALKSDGTVVAWGPNGDDRTTVPEGLSDVIAIAGGGVHNLALKSDGTVIAWGANEFGQTTVPAGLNEIIAIAGGLYHSLVLKSDGTVAAWGNNEAGQATVPTGLSDVIAIAGGGVHSLALKSDGTVVAWGLNDFGQTTVPAGLNDVIAIAGGHSHNLALKSDGTVVAWGLNDSGQATVPEGLSELIAIAGGGGHSLMLKSTASQLPPGLTLSSQGTISGTPTLAGTYTPIFSVQNSSGSTASKALEIVIEPNTNTHPVIDSTTPPEGMVTMAENSSQAFSVVAHDPEGEPLTYHWTLNGEPVGNGSDSYTYTTDWGDAGFYVLHCYVSNDLWNQIVYAQWNITVPVPPHATLTGRVRGAGVPLEDAFVELRRVDGSVYRRVVTDAVGNYMLDQVSSGYYRMKAGADFYADVWYQNANHLDPADLLTVPAESVIGGLDFDLASGQSPALVEVTSDPAGADIYLDYWPTGEVTPATINVGEVGDRDWAGYRLAPHVITLKKAGHPRPSPQTVPAVEAETVAVSFDLTASATGALSIVTTPEGAAVYVDYADAAEGVTPIVVGNLAPGSHTILLRKSGYLQPRPITVWVLENETTEVAVPLEPDTAASRMMAEVKSVPQGIPIYVDYLPFGQVTDGAVECMDPASHEGYGWLSASHTILLRREGAPPMAPRYVPEIADAVHGMMIHLSVDPDGETDSNGDGIPDWLWAQYGYEDPYTVPDVHAIADASGMTYGEKLRAGLIPGDPHSRFEMGGLAMSGDAAAGITIAFGFDTVPGRRYVVQVREALMENGWTNISGVITATTYHTSFTAQMPGEMRNQFYRLMVLVP